MVALLGDAHNVVYINLLHTCACAQLCLLLNCALVLAGERVFVTDASEREVQNVRCSCRGYWRSSGEIVNHQQTALLELEFLIATFGGAEQVVVLCCGTGSGCVAAMRLGRNTTGIDNSPFQLNEACRRLKLFGMAEAAEIACGPTQKRLQDRAEELPEVCN